MSGVLVVGAGAVGGWFGAELADAGRDVTFLVREARARALARDGLIVRTPAGERRLTVRTTRAGSVPGPYDLVLLAVKAYALDGAMRDLAGAVGPQTAILPTLNGMQHLDRLRDRFGAAAVLGGACVVISRLDDDGGIRLLEPGASLTYGDLGATPADRLDRVEHLLGGAGFDARRSTTIELDMWEKWVLLAAGGAITTLVGGVAGDVLAVAGGRETAEAVVAECVAVATAAGFAPRAGALAGVRSRLLTDGSRFATSMYRDLTSGQDVESEAILGDLVDRGRAHGVATPLVNAARARLSLHRRNR